MAADECDIEDPLDEARGDEKRWRRRENSAMPSSGSTTARAPPRLARPDETRTNSVPASAVSIGWRYAAADGAAGDDHGAARRDAP